MWKIVLVVAALALGIPTWASGAEVVRVLPIQTIVDGIRPIFNEMYLELQRAGCLSAVGAASTQGDQITLILKCVEWQKDAAN